MALSSRAGAMGCADCARAWPPWLELRTGGKQATRKAYIAQSLFAWRLLHYLSATLEALLLAGACFCYSLIFGTPRIHWNFNFGRLFTVWFFFGASLCRSLTVETQTPWLVAACYKIHRFSRASILSWLARMDSSSGEKAKTNTFINCCSFSEPQSAVSNHVPIAANEVWGAAVSFPRLSGVSFRLLRWAGTWSAAVSLNMYSVWN